MQYKWNALTVTTVGTVMAGINTRILILALPTVARQLNAGAGEAIWITQSFQLAVTVSLLLIGRVSDLYGRVKLYNIGFVVFTIGSLLSALSPNAYFLIGFLVIQGVGAAILSTNSAAIITDASPRNELGIMLGINQTAFRAGAMVGLTLSGLILAVIDWRGLFYINIPVGIFGTFWARKRLREIAATEASAKIDWPGFALFSVGLTLALLGVTNLSYGTTGVSQGLALLVSGIAIILVFAVFELRTSSPLMDFRLFKNRLFTMGNIAQSLYSACWGGILLLISFYLQIGLGYTPLRAGIEVIPLEVAYLFSSLLAGKLSDKYGSRLLSTSGLALGVVGLLMLSSFGTVTPYSVVDLDLIITGIGSGLFVSPNTRAVMGSVPANRRGIAAGLFFTMFNIGFTASNALTILFITFGISYADFSSLLQGTVATASSYPVLRQEFLNGFRIAALIFAVIEIAAIVPSISRGSKETRTPGVGEIEV